MGRQPRFSILTLLMLIAIVALGLTVSLQYVRQRNANQRHGVEVARLRKQLHSTQQLLEALPVDDPKRACVLATPSFAYGRWTWRIYLPPGSRYTLRIRNGPAIEENGAWSIKMPSAKSQQMGLSGQGETTVVVEQIHGESHSLLGVSINEQQTVCLLYPDVAKCLAKRCLHQGQQLGSTGAEGFSANERLDLFRRWYPGIDTTASGSGPIAQEAVGLEVWLEPY